MSYGMWSNLTVEKGKSFSLIEIERDRERESEREGEREGEREWKGFFLHSDGILVTKGHEK